MVFTFPVSEHEKALNRFITNMNSVAGYSMGHETEIHIKEEFSTYNWIMEGLLERSRFSIDQKNIESENLVGYVCSKL